MPKNIILLSDGTGNSASGQFKTNVWRLYQAIDINPPRTTNEPEQVVYFDDGVGTGGIPQLAFLGLGFGIGLAQNIKDLYAFLCRNYEPGDNIFLFGFSRGAFTVRMLAGMILRCGIVDPDNDVELNEQVEIAYSAFRRDGALRASKSGRAWFYNLLSGGYEGIKDRKYVSLGDKIKQRFTNIAFIGVWDTVDAYGVPLDEVKLGIDRYVWPMTLADRELSPHVDRVCHALSLDDERPTFRPVLWSEYRMEKGVLQPVSDKQLTQVWFAGVHVNVGGGYPDDGLAYVTLQWMLDEARAQGLWIYPEARRDADSRGNPHGRQYDSRAGLAGYFRYGPRRVDELCNDVDHGVKVDLPKVHRAVITRIERWNVAYAPVSFPTDYVIMDSDGGNPPKLVPSPPPAKDDKVARLRDTEKAWNAVVRRRWAYFLTVWLTFILAGLPILDRVVFCNVGSTAITAVGRYLRHLLSFGGIDIDRAEATIAKGMGYVPKAVGWSETWIVWWQHHPLFFTIAAVLLAWLFIRKSAKLQQEIFARADYAWRKMRINAIKKEEPNPLTLAAVVRPLRTPIVASAYRYTTSRIIPFLLMLPVSIVLLFVLVIRIPKTIRIARLRRTWDVRATSKKPGTETPEMKMRKPCEIQPEPPECSKDKKGTGEA